MTKKVGTCKHCLGHAFDFDRPVKNWKGARACFMLLDGSFMDLGICDLCLDSTLDLDVLWKNVLAGWKEELMMAVSISDSIATHNRSRFLAGQAHDNFILAHLCSPNWQDALGDEVPLGLGW